MRRPESIADLRDTDKITIREAARALEAKKHEANIRDAGNQTEAIASCES